MAVLCRVRGPQELFLLDLCLRTLKAAKKWNEISTTVVEAITNLPMVRIQFRASKSLGGRLASDSFEWQFEIAVV